MSTRKETIKKIKKIKRTKIPSKIKKKNNPVLKSKMISKEKINKAKVNNQIYLIEVQIKSPKIKREATVVMVAIVANAQMNGMQNKIAQMIAKMSSGMVMRSRKIN